MSDDPFDSHQITIGLRRPKDEQPIANCSQCNRIDLNELRKAIDRGQRDSVLIYRCLLQAQYAGLSGEDTYALLAYEALCQLEEYAQRTRSLANPSKGAEG
jgi:hypothetical protein